MEKNTHKKTPTAINQKGSSRQLQNIEKREENELKSPNYTLAREHVIKDNNMSEPKT